MMTALIMLAVGVIVGVPIILYGAMRLDERGGRLSWLVILLGLTLILAPLSATVILHQEMTGLGRYLGR